MAERQMHSAVNAAVLRPSEVRVLLGAPELHDLGFRCIELAFKIKRVI